MANQDQNTLTLKKQSDATWSNETVSVASKLPMPFTLQLFRKVKRTIQAHGGTHTEEIFEPIQGTKSRPSSFIIAGNGYKKTLGDNGKQVSAGYAITSNIPKDFWDEWSAQHESHDALQNHMIFAHKEHFSVVSMTKENEKRSAGMMDRIDPRAIPKQSGVKVESDDRNFQAA